MPLEFLICGFSACLRKFGRIAKERPRKTYQATPPADVRLSLGLGRLRKICRNSSSRGSSFKLRSCLRSEVRAENEELNNNFSEYDFSSPMNCSTPMNCTTPIGVGHITPFMAMTPELSSSPRQSCMDSNKLFPLFRPLAEKKVGSEP